MSAQDEQRPHPIIGWREIVDLPDLGVVGVKAKIDTGARSSSIHAFDVSDVEVDGVAYVRFSVHPNQRDTQTVIRAEAPLLERRFVRSSDGRGGMRPVIRVTLRLAGDAWLIDLTLARRDLMGFRMLVGREALRGRVLVDPGRSFTTRAPGLSLPSSA